MRFTILAVFFLSVAAFAQPLPEEQLQLTGTLSVDTKLISLQEQNSADINPGAMPQAEEKSPLLAGVLSALVPGAGEVYNGDYVKGAIFFAVEVAAVTAAIIYNTKGDDKTAEFEAYADENWSVVKYSEWMMAHKSELGIPEDCVIQINPNTELPPWERVTWSEVNHCESFVTGPLGSFSHRLEVRPEQQYYEMIGKYRQFGHGWADRDDATASFLDATSPMFDYYTGLRGDANTFYNNADKAVLAIVLNHVISATDAIWSAVNHNKDLAVRVTVQRIQLAESDVWVPNLSVRYSF